MKTNSGVKTMKLNSKEELNIRDIVNRLEFAFQPIVNTKTGKILGYEALLRNYNSIGFESIFELFDFAHKNGILYHLDLELRKKAINTYTDAFKKGLLLFYNLDSRILEDKNYKRGFTKRYLQFFDIDPSLLVFEISERFKLDNPEVLEIVENYSNQGFKIALDDFGVGHVCFESFYKLKPDIVKIDGFFIDGINEDIKKKTVMEAIVKLANSIGFSLVAEKVEKLEDIYELDFIGINLVQGYYFEKPKVRKNFDTDFPLNFQIKRGKSYREDLLKSCLRIEPLTYKDKTTKILDYIKSNDYQYIPIVNELNVPVSVINVKKILKGMANSKYFVDLYIKDSKKIEEMESFMEKPAILEIGDTVSLEKLTNLLIGDRDIIVLTENYRYVGILSYKNLLYIVHKNKVYEAINTSPLTGLPGNTKIKDFIEENLIKNVDLGIVYFDFDNFKPFNDKYGFRIGDRVIQLFSNILSSHLMNKDYFVGHIGGDDFFAGKILKRFEDLILDVEYVIESFRRQVVSFYDREDVERGFILGKDRDGKEKKFGLLSVSAAVLILDKNKRDNTIFLDKVISELKKSAKLSGSNISIATLI